MNYPSHKTRVHVGQDGIETRARGTEIRTRGIEIGTPGIEIGTRGIEIGTRAKFPQPTRSKGNCVTVELAGKASFVYSCLHTTLMG